VTFFYGKVFSSREAQDTLMVLRTITKPNLPNHPLHWRPKTVATLRFQGDLCIVVVPGRTDKTPVDAHLIPKTPSGDIIIALGEKTGHMHLLTADEPSAIAETEITLFHAWNSVKRGYPIAQFQTGEKPVKLTHNTHGTEVIPPNSRATIYRQFESNPERGDVMVVD
jgi:hypothetical protein